MTFDTSKVDKNLVRLEYEKGVAWVILNRPEKRNAISPALSLRMLEIFDEVAVDSVIVKLWNLTERPGAKTPRPVRK